MKKNRALAIDSVSSSLSLALFVGDEIVENSFTDIRNHNTELLREIDYILKTNNTSLDDLDFIAIGIGPGSFTALRIAFSTVKGICYSKNIPIIGVSSIATLYKNIEKYSGIKIAMIDARKNSVYCSIYKDDENIKKEIDLSYEELLKVLEKLQVRGGITICGDGYTHFKDELDRMLLSLDIFVNEISPDNNIIHAKYTLELARKKYEENKIDNIFELIPKYIRKSEAEIKLEERK